jgi:hypothetical protein
MPKFKFIKSYETGNNVYEIYMPDGNNFRYSWDQMIPFSTNKVIRPHDSKLKEK